MLKELTAYVLNIVFSPFWTDTLLLDFFLGLIYEVSVLLVTWLGYIFLIYVFVMSSLTAVHKGIYRESDKLGVLKAGLDGEEYALSLVSGLPDSCHVFTNLVIPWHDRKGRDRTSETDLIVVSPFSITIIENKYYKGTVSGKVSDNELIHGKYRQDGEVIFEENFYNPIKQVQTHAEALRFYLKEHGVKECCVQRCVLFNNDVTLEIEGDTGITSSCPVFDLAHVESMLEYVCSGESVTVENNKKILQALDNLIPNEIKS